MNFDTMTKPEVIKTARALTQELKLANERINELEQKVNVSEAQEQEIVLNLSGVARYANIDGKPTVATIKFNPVTKQAKVDTIQVFKEDYKAAYEAARLLEEKFGKQKE